MTAGMTAGRGCATTMVTMTGTPLPQDFDIALVGGGAGGVMTAIQTLRLSPLPLRIVLIEPAAALGQGVAYSTSHPEHVLNVPARGMSAFDDAPGDFVAYLAEVGAEEEVGVARGEPAVMSSPLESRFIERHRYGRYLCDRLGRARASSLARLQVVQDHVVALSTDPATGAARLRLGSGIELRSAGVVLALGNAARPLPARGALALPAGRCLEAWDFDALKTIAVEEEVCIVGSGLSMVDTMLSLAADGHRGVVHALSRHAWLPMPHAATPAAAFDVEALLRMSLRQRLRRLRELARQVQAQGQPWQAVMERLRPHGQALWQSLSVADQRRFLRHGVRAWDVHRHRVAAPVHAQLQQLLRSGRLRLHRGRVQAVACQGGRIEVQALDVKGEVSRIGVDRVVNATGTEMRAWSMRNPLLTDLLAQGLVQPGPHGIGLRVARDGSAVDAQGHALPWLQVLGSLRVGCLWDSTAVPELRGQAENAARCLLALHANAPH